MKKELLLILFLGWYVHSMADGVFRDSVVMDEVQINGSRNRFFREDFKTYGTDTILYSLLKNESFQNALQFLAPIQIINYGSVGSLSSIRLRGGTGNHTLVNWNGFPVNSLTSGSADISMLSFGAGDDVQITLGGSGAIYGNGAIGGVVDVDHRADFARGTEFEVMEEVGSFRHQNLMVAFKTSNEKISFSLKGMYLDALNNFPYTDLRGRERSTDHNAVNTYAILPFVDINAGKAGKFGLGAWLQRKDKQIPVTMNSIPSAISSQNQTDSIFRVFARWNWVRNGYCISAKSAYFDETLIYSDKNNPDDDFYKIHNNLGTKRSFNDINLRYFLNNGFSFDIGGQYSYLTANVVNYGNETIQEDDASLIAAMKYRKDRYIINLSGRMAYNSSFGWVPLYSVGGRYKIVDSRLGIRFNLANRYRQPTFNDRYWQPYGNIDLKPEKGYNVEIGFGGELIQGKHILTYDATGYYSQINDLIEWVPTDDDKQEMTPRNNKKVEVSGFEFGISDSYHFKNGLIKAKFDYAFNRTINIEKESAYYGNYLRYMPLHKLSSSVIGVYKTMNLALMGYLSSRRFVSDDNSAQGVLPTYFVVNMYYNYKFYSKKTFSTTFFFKVNNLFDTDYQEIENYQMPGRSFYIGINFNLNNKFK